jgi:hypothetical protein
LAGRISSRWGIGVVFSGCRYARYNRGIFVAVSKRKIAGQCRRRNDKAGIVISFLCLLSLCTLSIETLHVFTFIVLDLV